MHIHLFGRVRASAGHSATTDFPGHKRGALLAYLAHHSGQAVHREDVADALWPDGDPDSNRHRLRQELAALRKQLDDAGIASGSLLHSTREDLRLNAERVRVDTRAYQDALRLARRCDDPARRETLLEEAAQLYAGPFLKDYDLPWTRTVRSHLEVEHRKLMMELGEIRASRGNLPAAAEAFRGVLTVDPLDESAHLRLIRLYGEHDQLAQAMQQYREMERVLREELAVSPPAEARELLEQMRAKRPGNAASEPRNGGSSAVAEPRSVQSAEPTAPDPSVPHRPVCVSRPLRHAQAHRRRREALTRWAMAAVALVTVAIGALLLRGSRPHTALPKTPGLPSLPIVWEFADSSRPGELPDSEPTSIASVNRAGTKGVYVCGFTKTVKEDVDILTQYWSQDGRLVWSTPYSSPEHDADRAYSVIPHEGGLFVVGETYVPPGHGKKDGWRHLLLNYDESGRLLWQARHPDLIWEGDQRQIVGGSDGKDGAVIAGTIVRNGVRLAMVTRYAGDGKPMWTTTIRPAGSVNSRLRDLVADPRGYLVCGGADMPAGPNGGRSVGFVARLSPADGRPEWVDTLDGGQGGGNEVRKLGWHGSAGIYAVCDLFTGDVAAGGSGQTLGVTLFDFDGRREWTRIHRSAGPRFFAQSAGCDFAGSLFLCGYRQAPDGGGDTLTACYDPGGSLRWERISPAPPDHNAVPGSIVESTDVIALNTQLSPLASSGYGPDGWQVEQYSARGEPISLSRHSVKLGDMDRHSIITPVADGIVVASQTGTKDNHVIHLTKYSSAR